MSAGGEQFWQLLQEVQQLRQLAARQVELLEAILDSQARLEQEIIRERR